MAFQPFLSIHPSNVYTCLGIPPSPAPSKLVSQSALSWEKEAGEAPGLYHFTGEEEQPSIDPSRRAKRPITIRWFMVYLDVGSGSGKKELNFNHFEEGFQHEREWYTRTIFLRNCLTSRFSEVSMKGPSVPETTAGLKFLTDLLKSPRGPKMHRGGRIGMTRLFQRGDILLSS